MIVTINMDKAVMNTQTRGFFITIEGPEGAGKSTLAQAIEKHLQKSGKKCLRTREPGGTPLAEQLRDVLKRHKGEERLHTATELLLMEAARVQHVEEVIRPALDSGVCVICDRFYDSTSAYQGGARGVESGIIEYLNNYAVSGCHPDLTILLDLPVESGFARTAKREQTCGKFDRFEQENIEFHRNVRAAFLKLAEKNSSRIKVVDALRTREEIAHDVEILIDECLFKVQ